MAHSILLADEVAARARCAFEALIRDHDVATHAAGQIDDHVDFALADAFDNLAVVAGIHAELAGFRFPYMNVNDGRAGLGGGNRRSRNFRGSNRAVRALGNLGVVTGDSAGNNDVLIHKSFSAADKRFYYLDNNI